MIIVGDALDKLRTLPSASVQCCITSPPYWFLRDYGVAGQIGLEGTVQEWVERLVVVFDEVRRVLRDDGVLFVNVGDSYAGSGRGGNATAESSGLQGGQDTQQQSMVRRRGAQGQTGRRADRRHTAELAADKPRDIRPKNLLGQPWRLAFALQDAGWYWRDTIVWHKLNPMPSSVRDRCTPSWEPVLMFSKSARYYWDTDAIKEPCSDGTHPRIGRAATFDRSGNAVAEHVIPGQSAAQHRARYKMPDNWATHAGGHGSFHRDGREKGAPAGRKLAKVGSGTKNNESFDEAMAVMPETRNKRNVWSIASEPMREEHFAAYPTALVRPCVLAASRPGDTILDPFSGTATTGVVAIELGREYIGIELSEKYAAMSRRRLSQRTIGLPLESVDEPRRSVLA